MKKPLVLIGLVSLLVAGRAIAQEGDKPSLYIHGDSDKRGGSCVAKESAHVNIYEGCDAKAYDNTIIKAYDKCRVECFDQSVVYANANVKVKAHDNTRVFAQNECEIEASGAASVRAEGACKIAAHGSVIIYASDKCEVKAFDHTTVYGEGNAVVEAHDQCVVIPKGNCKVINAAAYDVQEVIFGGTENASRAYKDFSTKIKLNRTDEVALYNRAQIDLRLNKIDQAFNDISDAIQVDPNNGKYLLLRSYVYYKQGKQALSAEDLKQAHFVDPATPQTVNFETLAPKGKEEKVQ